MKTKLMSNIGEPPEGNTQKPNIDELPKGDMQKPSLGEPPSEGMKNMKMKKEEEDLTQLMNTLSVVIQNNMTVEELAMTDFFFQPHYNKPWSLLNAVALEAL